MFVLNCDITIGSYRFNTVHDVRITRSIHSFIDTAKIQLPASARLKFNGEKKTESIIQSDKLQHLAPLFRVGDKVSIQLAYDQDYKKEFQGFVKRVNFTSPLEIECEGYSWPLRQKNINKSWKQTTLKSVLQEVIKGTEITLSKDIPDVNLNNVFFRNTTADEALKWIKDKLVMTVFFNFNELFVGLAFTEYKGDVKYRLGWNVIKDDELKYHLAKDMKIKIKAIYVKNDNSRIEAEVGDDDGSIRTVYFSNIQSKDELIKTAKNRLNDFKYDGYQGKITAFLQPYCEHGYKAILDDPQYPERSGNYLIESVDVEFGMNGAKRTCEVGVKI